MAPCSKQLSGTSSRSLRKTETQGGRDGAGQQAQREQVQRPRAAWARFQGGEWESHLGNNRLPPFGACWVSEWLCPDRNAQPSPCGAAEGPAATSPRRRHLLAWEKSGAWTALSSGHWAREILRLPLLGHSSPATPTKATHSEMVCSPISCAKCLSALDTNII